MLKGLGIAAIILACWGLGGYMGVRLRERRKRLGAIRLFIGELSDRIRTGSDIKTIVSEIGQDAGISFSELTPAFAPDSLNEGDKKLLAEFLQGIGLSDTESQTQRCKVYGELFAVQESKAALQVREKASLYGKLGIFSGLFIAVMLV